MRWGVAVSPAAPSDILGYFTLIAIKIVDTELPEDLARTFKIRNLAAEAPAVLLAQLGVDRKSGGIGLGTFVLKQAMRHAHYGALEVGGVALIVDAVNPEVAAWYSHLVPDFLPLTPDGLRLILPMRTLAAAFTLPNLPCC